LNQLPSDLKSGGFPQHIGLYMKFFVLSQSALDRLSYVGYEANAMLLTLQITASRNNKAHTHYLNLYFVSSISFTSDAVVIPQWFLHNSFVWDPPAHCV